VYLLYRYTGPHERTGSGEKQEFGSGFSCTEPDTRLSRSPERENNELIQLNPPLHIHIGCVEGWKTVALEAFKGVGSFLPEIERILGLPLLGISSGCPFLCSSLSVWVHAMNEMEIARL
jgi:hypothetical protein